MKKILSLLLLCCACNAVFAQQNTLFVPRQIQRAFDKETRSRDGLPGKNYWQNRAEYKIDVSLDLPTRRVDGVADIRYFNQSPDTLKTIRLKLAHDLWRKGGQRGYDLTPSDITDAGVDVQRLSVGGKPVENPNKLKANTFLNIKLETPLPPGRPVQLGIQWSYIAPAGTDAPRECVCDSTSWFLAYWYPQVAVYDDLHGWADAPYNGVYEQYNDFSDYEVRVQVPSNVMVWATGELQNASEIFQPEFLGRFERAKTASNVIKIFSPEDYADKTRFFKATDKTHTLRYKASGVPDFAFAISDHFLWDATSVVVDDSTGRRTLVAAAYDPKSKDYYEVCKIAQQGIRLMSTYLPGYPYPYPAMTVFNGNDGMEFPMMCNDASTHPQSPVGLTVHEISHTYFPFMMGINEQYYAWMDEGWASFFDVTLSDTIKNEKTGTIRNYAASAGTDNDIPPMAPSRFLNSPAYRVAAYTRPQAAYFTLLDMLGYEKFHACMKTYMNRWKGKHPMPFDFFNTWNAASGQDLDWFWKAWFFDWGYPDLAVKVEKVKKQEWIIVENKGTMPVALHAEVEYSDGSKETLHQTAAVWMQASKFSAQPTLRKEYSLKPSKNLPIKKVTLGHRFVADANTKDNVWESK